MKTFLEHLHLNLEQNSQKCLIQVPKIHNTKVSQFWQTKIWKDRTFQGLSKYHFFKIWFFQKGPQFPSFSSVFMQQGLVCKIPEKWRGFFASFANRPWREAGKQAAACLLPPLPIGGRRCKEPLQFLGKLQRGPCCMENWEETWILGAFLEEPNFENVIFGKPFKNSIFPCFGLTKLRNFWIVELWYLNNWFLWILFQIQI